MQTEIINQIKHLPIADRIEIIEEVSRSVKEDLQKNGNQTISIEERKKAVDKLRGIASVAGKTPPTDEEVKGDYINYISVVPCGNW
jgi:hypothetical protein